MDNNILEFFELLAAMRETSFDTNELTKLEEMLKDENIPYRREGTQICYYGKELPERKPNQGLGINAICSVIAHGYGSEEGLLEIRGLMTKEEIEETGSYTLGYLDAENVFKRIKKHFYKED